MQDVASWVTPLLILPAVGLFLVSTASRYEAVHAEIHALLAESSPQAAACATHVSRRARLFRNAMFCLYLSACVLGTAGLIGALSQWIAGAVHWSSWVLSVAGVASLVLASLFLMRESAVSLVIVKSHTAELARKSE